MLFTNLKDWQNARKDCQSVGGGIKADLTALIDDSDTVRLADWMSSLQLKGINEAWIGLTTDPNNRDSWDDPKSWYWVRTNEKPTYSAWASGYPSKLYGVCGSLVANTKKWQSNICAAFSRVFVCDIPY
jgi:hypothetical protein